MASMRAELVAEVLWELKKINKLATYTEISQRAGFKPGANGKTILTSLDVVKRDWPHLQWWRALPDDCCLAKDSDHCTHLQSMKRRRQVCGSWSLSGRDEPRLS